MIYEKKIDGAKGEKITELIMGSSFTYQFLQYFFVFVLSPSKNMSSHDKKIQRIELNRRTQPAVQYVHHRPLCCHCFKWSKAVKGFIGLCWLLLLFLWMWLLWRRRLMQLLLLLLSEMYSLIKWKTTYVFFLSFYNNEYMLIKYIPFVIKY